MSNSTASGPAETIEALPAVIVDPVPEQAGGKGDEAEEDEIEEEEGAQVTGGESQRSQYHSD